MNADDVQDHSRTDTIVDGRMAQSVWMKRASGSVHKSLFVDGESRRYFVTVLSDGLGNSKVNADRFFASFRLL